MLTHYEGRTKTDRNRSPNSINHSDENRSMFLKGNSNDLGKKYVSDLNADIMAF